VDLGRIILLVRDGRAVHLPTDVSRSRLLAAAIALAMVFTVFAVQTLPAHAASAKPAVVTGSGADFNGDGFADLATGVPMEDFHKLTTPGGVSVLYGTAGGLDATSGIGDQWITQDSTGMQGDGAESGDQMGLAVAVGDFNGDGFTDLAAGVPGEDVGSKADAGAVNVIYGSAAGLDPTGTPGNQFWTLDNASVPGTAAAPRDALGRSLAAGDFNGDGFADLAVGAPERNVNHVKDDGAALVLYGSSSGLTATGSQLWNRFTGVPGSEHPGDQMAWSMTAGDFDGDGNGDLVLGNPFDDVGAMTDAGTAAVLYGTASGLSAANSQLLSQDTPGVPGNAETNDSFGWDVVAGAFDGSLKDSLAVGVPLEAVSGLGAIGAVNVFPGSAAGLTGTGSQVLSQNATGVPGAAKDGDAFGASLAAGNFGSGGAIDLAVGVAADTIKRIPAAGSVNVFYGSASGLSVAGSQLWDQDTAGILDASEPGDLMGADVAAGDYNGDGHADLAAAVTYEDLGSLTDAGAFNVIYADSGPNGLMAAGNQFWNQDSPGMQNTAHKNDQFAYSLA
jgi:hypothetical protein